MFNFSPCCKPISCESQDMSQVKHEATIFQFVAGFTLICFFSWILKNSLFVCVHACVNSRTSVGTLYRSSCVLLFALFPYASHQFKSIYYYNPPYINPKVQVAQGCSTTSCASYMAFHTCNNLHQQTSTHSWNIVSSKVLFADFQLYPMLGPKDQVDPVQHRPLYGVHTGTYRHPIV